MLKRILSAFVACATAICFSITCFADDSSKTASRVQTAVPKKIAFLGDSIAAGYGLQGYKFGGESPKDSYAFILGENYKAELSGTAQGEMVNLAISGDTSSQLLSRLQSGNMDNQLAGSKAVVISIGGNDVMGPMLAFFYVGLGVRSADDFKKLDPSIFSDPATLKKMEPVLNTITSNINAFSQNITKITEYLHSKLGNAALIVQTVYNPLDSNPSYAAISSIVGGKLDALNNAIKYFSGGGENYAVCDVAEAFKGKSSELTNIESFDIHPSAAGHKVIAQEVDKVVRAQKYYIESAPESSQAAPETSSSESISESSNADSSVADVQSSAVEESSQHSSLAEESSASSSSDSSKSAKKTVDKGTIYWTLGLFFGGFILVFAVVMIIFKKRSK